MDIPILINTLLQIKSFSKSPIKFSQSQIEKKAEDRQQWQGLVKTVCDEGQVRDK